MLRMTYVVLIALLIAPCMSVAGTIDVQIKGVDDGVKTTKQQDYKEAVLFAKREAIERAGVKVKALTTAKDFIVHSDYIETKAEAVLLPGYNIIDVGYTADGTYQIVLIGKVKSAVSEEIDSKELRYAKSLYDMGKKSDAKKIINDILKNSKDDGTVAEAMFCQVLWKFSSDPAITYSKLEVYYPDSKYVGKLKNLLDEREAERKRIAAEKKREKRKRIAAENKRKIQTVKQKYGIYANGTGIDGQFYAFDTGVVVDTKTGLMWAAKDNGSDINWRDAKRYCKNYIGGNYTDWRMPTVDELAGLHNRRESYLFKQEYYDFYVTKLIQLTTCCPWAYETHGSGAAFFLFFSGNRNWYGQSDSITLRVLPVRGGN